MRLYLFSNMSPHAQGYWVLCVDNQYGWRLNNESIIDSDTILELCCEYGAVTTVNPTSYVVNNLMLSSLIKYDFCVLLIN